MICNFSKSLNFSSKDQSFAFLYSIPSQFDVMKERGIGLSQWVMQDGKLKDFNLWRQNTLLCVCDKAIPV